MGRSVNCMGYVHWEDCNKDVKPTVKIVRTKHHVGTGIRSMAIPDCVNHHFL